METRKIALSIVLLMSLYLSMNSVGLVRASPGVNDFRWKEPYYHGHDEFYGATIIAYTAGSDAVCQVQFSNDHWRHESADITVDLEIFGENHTSDEVDVELGYGETSIFTISLEVPEDASTLFTHRYRLIAKYEFEADIDKDVAGPYWDFAVYSSDQADARDLRTELARWDLPPDAVAGFIPFSAEAWELSQMALAHAAMGYDEYELGNFGSAETHYSQSLNYTKRAISAYASTSSTFEDAMVSLFTSGSGLMNFYGIALLVGGIGFLLMGIGVVIYLIRRSGRPASPT